MVRCILTEPRQNVIDLDLTNTFESNDERCPKKKKSTKDVFGLFCQRLCVPWYIYVCVYYEELCD